MDVSKRTWLARCLAPFLCALPALLALPAAAQEEDEQVHRAPDIVVHEETLEPAEIFEDRPVETEILTEEEIRELPAENLAEVVEKLPGLSTRSRVQGEEAALSIEGMPPEYTTVLVDGQRYTGELGAVSDVRNIPLENVERIEIRRGAQGLRHGTEAGGGVVDVIRKDPPEDGWRGSLDAAAGEDDALQGSGTLAWGEEHLGASLSFDHDQIDGFDRPDDVDEVLTGGTADSRRLSRNADGQIVWRPAPELTLRTRMGWRREDEDVVPDNTPDADASPRDEERWRVSQEAEALVGEATRLTGSLTWFQWELDTDIGRSVVIDEDEWKLDLAAEHFLDTGPLSHVLSFGVDGRIQRLRLDEGELPANIENDSIESGTLRERFERAAFFLIAETDITEWISTELGARLQLHSEFGSTLVPQAAVLIRPHETLRLRFSWGLNQRTPSLRDLFQPPAAQQGGAYFLSGNPDLEPEESTSWRAGFEYSPFEWLSLSGVGFWNDIDDRIRARLAGQVKVGTRTETIQVPTAEGSRLQSLLFICEAVMFTLPDCAGLDASELEEEIEEETVAQVRERDQFSNLFQRVNVDKLTTRGIEARLEFRRWRFAQLQLGYTLLDTELTDRDRPNLTELPDSPKHTFDGRLRLEAPWTRTALTLRARWRDRALLETIGTGLPTSVGEARTDPSFTLDTRLVQPVGETWEFYVDGRNLTDQRTVDSVVVRGRTFFAGVRVRFD